VVLDEDVGTDDIVGMVTIKISSLCINNGVKEWFPIEYHNKEAG